MYANEIPNRLPSELHTISPVSNDLLPPVTILCMNSLPIATNNVHIIKPKTYLSSDIPCIPLLLVFVFVPLLASRSISCGSVTDMKVVKLSLIHDNAVPRN